VEKSLPDEKRLTLELSLSFPLQIRPAITSKMFKGLAVMSGWSFLCPCQGGAMDDLRKLSLDRKRINVQEKWERSYWTKKLGISSNRLRELVKRFGTSVSKVRKS
jgi:Protein of unknown function (DUF3606)